MDGIKAAFRDYSVQFVDAKPAHCTAQQTLELRGGDSEALLDLIGRLQSLGLAIGSLDWQVSADHAQQAYRDATLAALKRLRTEATDAAAALGMQIDRFQTVRLGDEPRPIPFSPGRIIAPAAMAAPMLPPRATREQQDITAEVSADVVLRATRAARNPTP